MNADTAAADCMWLYASGNHYQLVGPMQQLILMEAETSVGEDKEFILVPHGMIWKACSIMCTVCIRLSFALVHVWQTARMQIMSEF